MIGHRGFGHATAAFLAAALLALQPRPARGQASRLPCPACHPPERFWAAAGELMAAQAVPWAFTRFVVDGEWSRIGPTSWLDNLKFAWQWDNNEFDNNQFAHPYHGSLYFSSARSNGYDFWQSAPWALGGSLMWELFGEVYAPAPNDLANTTLGGIGLGEMLFRFSSLVLKNEATGRDRTMREVSALLIDPVRGFNRLVRGEMTQVSQTPPDWRPSRLQATMDVGYRRFSTTSTLEEGRDQALVRFGVYYGDQFADLGKAPFSTFQAVGTLASETANHKALQELMVRGNLGAKPIGTEGSGTALVGFMTYQYVNNPAVSFGAQGFEGGLIKLAKPTDRLRLFGEALVQANPIAAIRSDYFVTAEGRDYDYGVMLGGHVSGTAVWVGRGTANVNGGFGWLPVVSGFAGNHYVWALNMETRGYVHGKYGLGVSYYRMWRRSRYTFNADVDQNLSEARVFVSLAIPRWQD